MSTDPLSKRRSEERKINGKMPGGITGKGFKPGQSGNPGGRPKSKPITEIYQEIFADPKIREKVKKQIIATMTRKGMAGVLERRESAERIEGKVAQEAEVSVTIATMSDEELLKRLAKLVSK
jgi:Family of unknown function (DUF5681)